MIVAWVGFASIGIITARYLKPLWLSHSLFGVRIWFAIHRSSMLAALIFVCIGAICIFLHVDGFVFVCVFFCVNFHSKNMDFIKYSD
ncbi:hypothetical protein BLA29_012450 [Euroglyphus maynei]|uniref:Cytochrome b561 domain-containing protein n=1 Tax=Euroglyphus maynei TaxID=6958 RepID=A0A1Y3AW54_EURMA|nr:hypothetical protein BLA29_012450 [Euroglyphus maynei]